MNTKGFTLIELLIVIAIIGILAAVLIPSLLGARTRANEAAAQTHSRNVYTVLVAELTASPQAKASAIAEAAPPCTEAGNFGDASIAWGAPPQVVTSCDIAAVGESDFTVSVETDSGKVFVNGQLQAAAAP